MQQYRLVWVVGFKGGGTGRATGHRVSLNERFESDCPTLEKVVKYTRIVCQNVELALPNIFVFFPKNMAYFARY